MQITPIALLYLMERLAKKEAIFLKILFFPLRILKLYAGRIIGVNII